MSHGTVYPPFTLDFILHKNENKLLHTSINSSFMSKNILRIKTKLLSSVNFFQKEYRKNIFAKNMKKIMIFWLIFNFCLMVLTMYAAIMELLNKILTKRKKLKAKIQKSSLAKMFLWSKTTWNRAWNILEMFIYRYLTLAMGAESVLKEALMSHLSTHVVLKNAFWSQKRLFSQALADSALLDHAFEGLQSRFWINSPNFSQSTHFWWGFAWKCCL